MVEASVGVSQVHDAICCSFLSGSATCSVYVCALTSMCVPELEFSVKCEVAMVFWVIAGILLTRSEVSIVLAGEIV